MMPMYDVIVVGAGPGGAAVSALLAEEGARVLLLEKERFPRFKACAGGLEGVALRALAEMGIDVGPVMETTAGELCLTSNGSYPSVYRFEQPFALTIMRPEFDALLARTAMERGAEFHDGEPVKSVLENGRTVSVTTSRQTYEGRLLVGADGVYSLVARTFGLNSNPILYVLVEAEVKAGEQALSSLGGISYIDISVWPLGYSWIFPKRSHLSIGTGVPRRSARQLMLRFDQFQQRSGLKDAEVLHQKTHMLGFRRRRAPISSDRVLLVGDAAGLVDPNTGAGIGWALLSSQFAAKTLLSCLRGEIDSLRAYTRLVDDKLEPELRAARILRNSIVLRLVVTRGRATQHESLWNEVIRVIRGDEQYSQWYDRSKLARFLAWTRIIPL